jgi:small subunit ribosomal protein S8
MPASRLKIALAGVLKREGYIEGYVVKQNGPHQSLRINLAYTGNREPVIGGLQRVSKPGLRVYAGRGEIPRVYGGLGVAIMSTPEGVMTGKEARRRGVGGEVLCYVW